MDRNRVWMALAMLCALMGCARAAQQPQAGPDLAWTAYGGDQGGTRYSPATQIRPDNVTHLTTAWRFSLNDIATKGAKAVHISGFENTPLMVGGEVLVCSPFNEVFALDPGTGKLKWSFDPHIDPSIHYPNKTNCRGVAFWTDPAAVAGAACASRVFLNTNDRRLFSLDADTGRPCIGFGRDGVVDVADGVALHRNGEMQITSPPVVARGVVVVGSSIDDNQRVKEVSGAVRAFDARTGARLWSFDPLGSAPASVMAGAANVWAPMSIDELRGLVFLPTTSPSPDFWGGARLGDDGDADAVVALDIVTGHKVWAFKTVHHDVWDYDNPAQPTLADVTWEGRTRPALLQTTKQGLLFTLDRQTGQPIIPVEERSVPHGAAPGDQLSPTQPFPVAPRPLSPSIIREDEAYGLTAGDRKACAKMIAAARHEGLFTPPSVQGTILYPFTGGGSNWGGLAFDPTRQVAVLNTSSAMHLVTLIPADKVKAAQKAEPDVEISAQEGAPFGMRRVVMRGPLGLPCNPPPWGQLHAVDMKTGRILWEVPFGGTGDLVPGSQLFLRGVGSPNFGGPIITGSGLIFIGAALDNYLRAFDLRSGKELWRARLPGGAQATPMTYVWKGRQYVLMASGRHDMSGTKAAEEIIAYALP